jgi:hypothetical protein
MRRLYVSVLPFVFLSLPASAGVLTYGDKDLEGFGYPSGQDPTTGATLQGLAPNIVSLATNSYGHSYPFAPSAGDYPGTDQIYVGTTQTQNDDGYSGYSGRLHGPQVITLDYSSLIPAGQSVATLTLGLGADDFQFPTWGNPFTASINGIVNAAITTQLNALNQTGPYERFFSVGIDPSTLLASKVLTLSINEGGNGGDGWALDFLTVGVTTSPTSTLAIWLGGTGTWSTATKWTTNPNAPANGSPSGALYDVQIPTGTVNLDINPAIQSLSFGTSPTFTSTLNLATNHLIVESSGASDKSSKLASLAAAIKSGSAGATWTGPGITSANAASDPTHYGVGLFDNAILGLATFGGTAADSSSILLAITHLGDANHNGVVDIQDQSIVTNNWQKPGTNWANGDLNLDGFVDIQDLTIITNNWQQTSSFSDLAGQSSAQTAPVPEPSTLPLLAFSAALLIIRPRRRPPLTPAPLALPG